MGEPPCRRGRLGEVVARALLDAEGVMIHPEEADHGLGVPDVDGQQHQDPSGVVSRTRSSPRSSRGEEWVSAPTLSRSTPAAA